MRKRINPEIYVYTLSYAYTFWGGAEAHLLDANIVGALSDDGRTHREPSEGKATVAQAKPPWEGASPTQKNNKIDGTWSYVFSLGTFYRDAPELGGLAIPIAHSTWDLQGLSIEFDWPTNARGKPPERWRAGP